MEKPLSAPKVHLAERYKYSMRKPVSSSKNFIHIGAKVSQTSSFRPTESIYLVSAYLDLRSAYPPCGKQKIIVCCGVSQKKTLFTHLPVSEVVSTKSRRKFHISACHGFSGCATFVMGNSSKLCLSRLTVKTFRHKEPPEISHFHPKVNG